MFVVKLLVIGDILHKSIFFLQKLSYERQEKIGIK